jgi:NADH-quinone oxidoreductase subunit J
LFSALAVFCGFGLTMLQVYQHNFFETEEEAIPINVADIGKKMLMTNNEGYALPFEVVSMLLLAAMIGCIVIAMREKKIINNEQETSPTEQTAGNNEVTKNKEIE